MSEGIRFGVNWTRANFRGERPDHQCFAIPGMPTSSVCGAREQQVQRPVLPDDDLVQRGAEVLNAADETTARARA